MFETLPRYRSCYTSPAPEEPCLTSIPFEPCIGVCSTGIGDAVCRGCKRFAHEVIDWNGYSQAQKQAIDARLDRFLAMCVANKLRIVDQKLLDWRSRSKFAISRIMIPTVSSLRF